MFIELTDHLRCPEPHDEAYLVLLPERLEGRRVMLGTLGCPVCGRIAAIRDGIVELGDPPSPPPEAPALHVPAEGAAALLGISGPGGFVMLVDLAARLAPALTEALPGVHFALVNAPPDVAGSASSSVVRASRLPVKRASMRAVIVAGATARDARWVEAAAETVLPGNRLVVDGPGRQLAGADVLAEAGGVWVARCR